MKREANRLDGWETGSGQMRGRVSLYADMGWILVVQDIAGGVLPSAQQTRDVEV